MTPSALIDLITALWLGFIGACVGSFLNVVAYRMPLGMSVIWKPSHCPNCKHPIRAYDNVPVLGWLWLKGRCRDCGEPISPRYAIVEFVMGLAFFVLAYAELFSGGANLLGGPVTEFVGAADTVWVPQWPLLGIYGYHGLLLSLVMCVVLCNRDDQVVPMSLVWLGVVVSVVTASMTSTSYLLPVFGDAKYAFLDRVLGCLLGVLFGSLVGRIATRAKVSCGTRPPLNLQRGCCLLGVFLGLRAVLSLSGLLIIAVALRAKSRSCSPTIVDALFCFALLQVLLEGVILQRLLH